MSPPTTTTTEDAVRTAEVRAAGAVLWRPHASGAQVALVHRPRYDDWSFPKGKLDGDESMPAAAVREVAEETGFRARLGALLGEVSYEVPEGRKLVRYWSAQALDGSFTPNDETDELRWVDPERAVDLLSYRHDLDVLRRFTEVGVPSAVVLLVRHAKAGSRHDWDDDDDLRPLSGTGREQAGKLAALLPLFGPDRIISAPPLRCRDTVLPLAETLGGMPVTSEPLFGESDYWHDPGKAVARLRELATEPGVTVVCSQGGVIPDLVGALAEPAPRQLGVDPADVPARKASTWVLTFDGDRICSADYYPRPTG